MLNMPSKFAYCQINDFEYLVEFIVSGSYLPATWGYWGGEPPETPELEIVEVAPMFDVEAILANENCPYTKEDLVGGLVDKKIYDKLRQELKL